MRHAMPVVLFVALAVIVGGFNGCSRKPTEEAATIREAVEVTPPVTPAPAGDEASADDAEPQASAEPDASDASAAALYTLTEDSYIGWAGRKPLGTHFGQFPSYEGTVTLQGDDLATAKAEVTFHIGELTSDDTRLTGTLLNANWFSAEEHPVARFVTTSIEPAADKYTVTGNLEIRGVAKSVSFPAAITLEDGTLTVSAEFSIDRTAWGVGQGLAEDLIVNNDVAIELEAIAELAEAS